MTLRPALARLERGFKRLSHSAVAAVTGARGYRYAGEQEAHADQLRETRVSLALMASATDEGEQVRMASDIEHGAESRLTVLLAKPRLTLEEKRERDAIQAALATRRQAFDAPAATPRRFFAAPAALALGGVRPWMIWTGLVSVLALLLGFQSVRLESAKANLREARQTMEQAQDERDAWRERATEYAAAVTDARAVARQSADALEAERAAQARYAARERRRQREIQNVIADSPEPPAWSLRDSGEVSQ